MEPEKKVISTEEPRKIRLTFTSTNVKSVEKTVSEFLTAAKSKEIQAYGPIRMPTKTLRITTRKTPCGEGSKTWSRYQLRIHKRVLDFRSTPSNVQAFTRMNLDPAVTIEITVDDIIRNNLAKPVEASA